MPPEIPRRIFLRAVAAAGVGLIAPLWLSSRARAALRVGDVPSRVTLSDMRGTNIVIPSDLTGKVALLHFWASWCPTCRGEMNTLETLYRNHGARGILPCSIGIGERKETALQYLRNVTISYPVLLDPGSATVRLFGVSGIPTYFVLDREGVIQQKIIGKADPEGLVRIATALLRPDKSSPHKTPTIILP